MNTPIYVAKKSAWKAVTPFRILFCWLIIPLFAMIAQIISLKNENIEFYEDSIITKKGIVSKDESRFAFSGVIGVSVKQGVGGRIFNYGDVKVDIVGRNWDIDTKGIHNPQALKQFLETRIQPTAVQNILVN